MIVSTMSLGIEMALANVLQKYRAMPKERDSEAEREEGGRLNVLVIVNVKSRYDDFRWFLM